MKYIATDCDGVLLDWNKGFTRWMKDVYSTSGRLDHALTLEDRYDLSTVEVMELIDKFNSSHMIGCLEPHKDALEVIKGLADKYKLVVITALGHDTRNQTLRNLNLKNLFGDTVVDVHYVGVTESKKETLNFVKQEYKPVAWLEDTIHHAISGAGLKIPSFVFDAPYNRRPMSPHLTRVDNWSDFANNHLPHLSED